MTNQSSPFKTVSKNLAFFPDQNNSEDKVFEGIYESANELGDSENEKNRIPVFIFADVNTGEEKFIMQSYSIKKAVETAKRQIEGTGITLSNIVFRFEYKGKTEVNGKPFNLFDTAYCTLAEWEVYKDQSGKGSEKPEKPEKPKK